MKINKKIIFETAFTVFNTACIVGAVVTTHYATVKAETILNKQENKENLSSKDRVKLTWKNYILPGTLTVCSVGMTIVSGICQITTYKQQLALMGIAATSTDKLCHLKDAIKETCDAETCNQIIEKAEIRAVNSTDPYITVGGRYDELVSEDDSQELFYDSYSDTWFKAPKTRVLNAEFHVNRNLSIGGFVTLQEFYNFLGLDELYERYKDSEIMWRAAEWCCAIDFLHIKRTTPDGMQYYELTFDQTPQTSIWWDENYY